MNLSAVAEQYSWQSGKGTVINKALQIDDFPVMKSVLGKVNAAYGCTLNSVLAAYYRNGSVSVRLHSDNEESLDPTQPIVVVSIGATRRVDFVDNEQESFRANTIVLNPSDPLSLLVYRLGSLYRAVV